MTLEDRSFFEGLSWKKRSKVIASIFGIQMGGSTKDKGPITKCMDIELWSGKTISYEGPILKDKQQGRGCYKYADGRI